MRRVIWRTGQTARAHETRATAELMKPTMHPTFDPVHNTGCAGATNCDGAPQNERGAGDSWSRRSDAVLRPSPAHACTWRSRSGCRTLRCSNRDLHEQMLQMHCRPATSWGASQKSFTPTTSSPSCSSTTCPIDDNKSIAQWFQELMQQEFPSAHVWKHKWIG